MFRSHPGPARAVSSSAFAGFRFPPEIIVLAVRRYLRYGLSYRDVEELLAERGIEVDHVTVYRWVQRFTPLLADAAGQCRHTVGDRWFVDETYWQIWSGDRLVIERVDRIGIQDAHGSFEFDHGEQGRNTLVGYARGGEVEHDLIRPDEDRLMEALSWSVDERDLRAGSPAR
jgi:hypothetical protein